MSFHMNIFNPQNIQIDSNCCAINGAKDPEWVLVSSKPKTKSKQYLSVSSSARSRKSAKEKQTRDNTSRSLSYQMSQEEFQKAKEQFLSKIKEWKNAEKKSELPPSQRQNNCEQKRIGTSVQTPIHTFEEEKFAHVQLYQYQVQEAANLGDSIRKKWRKESLESIDQVSNTFEASEKPFSRKPSSRNP